MEALTLIFMDAICVQFATIDARFDFQDTRKRRFQCRDALDAKHPGRTWCCRVYMEQGRKDRSRRGKK